MEAGCNMKKFGFIALIALCMAMVSCGGNGNEPDPGPDPKPDKGSIIGQWQLSSITTKASIGSETIDVYLEFTSDGNFSIYQVVGAGRPRLYTGSYTYADGVLKGKYADGTSIKPYDVTCSKGELKLTPQGGKEVDTYKSATIPQSVKDSAF